jgi:hypothetical protein
VRKMIPCEPAPPATVSGLTASLCKPGPGGAADDVTVSVPVLVEPLYDAVMTTEVVAATAEVEIVKSPTKLPVGTVTVEGTLATAGLLLESETTVVSGAAALTMSVPLVASPPTTVVGLISRFVNAVGGGGVCGVKLRTADQAPATPAELTPRTRQNCVVVARPPMIENDAVRESLCTSGALKALELAI